MEEGGFQPMEIKPRNKPRTGPIQARTQTQGEYLSAIENNTVTFGLGPAGTGKTYVSTAFACDQLLERKIDRIIIVRPTVEVGVGMGFLPGTIDQKYEPYLQPFFAVFHERLGRGATEAYMKGDPKIQTITLAHMRGLTFDRSWVLLDEAQNVTPAEMKMFLTRIGEDTKVVVSGDPRQKDLVGPSGLDVAVDKLESIPQIGVVRFTSEDVVRSGIVQDIVEAFEGDEDA